MEICSEADDAGERFWDLADDVELMERTHRSEGNDLQPTVFEVVENVRLVLAMTDEARSGVDMVLPRGGGERPEV